MKHSIILILCTLLLLSCSEQEDIDPRKTYKYSVFLRQSGGGRTMYVGSTVGLGSCAIIGRRALQERISHELAGLGWDIVCCWRTNVSQCEEEHRYQDKEIPYDQWIKNRDYHKKPQREHFFKPKR